jgi:hypothetical protein
MSGVSPRGPTYSILQGAVEKISIDIVKMNFSKFASFKGIIRKILNLSAVLI